MNPYEGLEDLSPSAKCGARTMHAALAILKEAGGELPRKEIMEVMPSRIKSQGYELTEWELEKYEKTGYTRWRSMLSYYSLGLSKAGYIRKAKGVWYLTSEGEAASKLGARELLDDVNEKYRVWESNRKDEEPVQQIENNQSAAPLSNQTLELEQLEEEAREGIRSHIKALNPYDFQDLVAALLRAMGYFTPFISPKGRDGGIDIIAYQDPLGSKSPRIKVQVKHRPEASIAVDDIRGLTGLLNKDGDIGLFVTSGRFTSESERFSRDSHIHIKLIDGSTLIDLWMEFYSKLTDEDKNRLPLHQIYFLGTNG
tara:strand:- start:82 stop:1017 length:936 start_codon:yes stop_codon:yes gene_type:complete